MNQQFTQTGGLRYGDSFWYATNYTTPFAQLRVSMDSITLSVSFLGLLACTFTFERSAIRRLRWRRGIFSVGLQIEHTVGTYPPFMRFWVRDRKALVSGLREFGYELDDSNRVAQPSYMRKLSGVSADAQFPPE